MEHQDSCLDLSYNNPSTHVGTNNILVVKLISNKIISHNAIISIINASWNLGENILVKPLDKSAVSCTFKKSADAQKFEDGGPWIVKGAILNLKRWKDNLTLEELHFS